ncbi:MAG: quinone oxidoreductase [Acidobacteria bacterium]|jgi:NADPH2:quinone reductase|nr:quinone oxidoreductase [Acidobacteriota bacterium]MDP7690225.1 quinone oxidoreductase [Vicinamibacterales bacterium]HJN45648.1 quinone oxidoreductase [Vicinamibacterales bacterium]
MAKAIRIHEHGGPEVLRLDDVDPGTPGPGQALIRQTAAGLNFIDVYHRTGLYPVPAMPAVIGNEGAGVVEAVGDGVTELGVGDRVAYSMSLGGYTEQRVVDAARLVRVPDAITDQQAAAMMLKGCTVQYLIRRIYPVKPGDTILLHAAAGGVGLIACQWAKHLGATVIGTVGSDEKAELARAHGCDHAIVYTRENVPERVKALTDGAGVPVVFDSVGKDTFMASLDCLQPRGLMVSYGNSSGAVEPFSPGVLAAKGSLFLTRPTLATYIKTREELDTTTTDLFDVMQSGAVKVEVSQVFPLEDAAQAHRDLEARKTTGSTVLMMEG